MSTLEDAVAVQDPQQQPKKLKPARKQVKPGQVEKKETPQTGKEYNIWYNKWAGGDREDSYSNKEKSQTRCSIRRDSGYTRANTTGMKYICLFFARGCCPYGYECQYRHTLPDPETALPDTSKDCFARDKFADYRDDMGGVGSFQRMNRTLYVGRIKETGNGHETEEVVTRHFNDYGTIERIRVLQHRSVAFVTFVHELHAQFAKEAMACQSLDNDEILNVRWATEDPNPTTKVSERAMLEEMGAKAIADKLDPRMVDAVRAIRALEDEDVLDEEGQVVMRGEEDPETGEPSAKRRRIARTPPPPASSEPPPQASGILSADTMEGLRYFAEIRKRNAANGGGVQQAAPVKPKMGLGGIADYGSDNDDD